MGRQKIDLDLASSRALARTASSGWARLYDTKPGQDGDGLADFETSGSAAQALLSQSQRR
ncbi:hypothetical protein MPC1_7240003 [Methylocella tundrae]|nr:hypothetical protein MPC1_7240003 [Methylocella tundrae]